MITWGEAFRPWIEAEIGSKLPADAQFLADVASDGQIKAVVAFSHYIEHDIAVSVAGREGSRAMLAWFYQYAFVQHRCCRVTARIRASNKRSQRLAERLGFQREGVLRQGYGDEDALIYGLLRDDYPWANPPVSRQQHPIPPPS